MINTSVNKNEHTIQSGVVDYPIGFPFYFNPDRTPQLRVKIGDEELRFNHNFKLSEDKGSVVLMPTEEESWTLEGPEDFSWMAKWDGKDLLIERAVPFVQDSDYQLGRISSEQIERDFDLSVMRDQALDSKIKKLRNDMVDEFAATDSRFDFVQEQMDNEFSYVRDEFAEADKGLSNKIDETKSELQKNIDDKLPLSGGVMTGPIEIETREADRRVLTFRASNGVSYVMYADPNGVQMPFKIYSTRDISPAYSGKYELGDWLNSWKTVYTTSLSAGGFDKNITVPEKAGTMALLEDVESKADKTELSNYLPLTGGTLTNLLSFDVSGTAGKNKGLIYVNTASGSTALIGAKTDDNGVLRDVAVIPKLQGETLSFQQIYSSFIGTPDSPVTRIHAKKIGTGLVSKLLTIPNGPGTIARLEDIPETYTKEELDAKFAEIPDSVDSYSKAEIDAKLSSVYKFKGSVANVDALPAGAVIGDTYNVEDTGANYAWDGSKWDKLSDTIDLTGYATEEYVDDNMFAIMDYIDDEIKPLKTDNKNLYNNQLVLRDMLNEKDENNEFIQLTTEAQTAIPAINELNEKKASKEDLSGYLPLSGGTMTGSLGIEDKLSFGPWKLSTVDNGNVLAISWGGAGRWLSFDYDSGAIYPMTVALSLGGSATKWSNVFTKKLNNGADLIVPTEGGTLARIEDIDERIGDISTALTAILGE